MKLKYGEQLAACTKHRPCPSAQFAPISGPGFRFVHAPVTDADFKPYDETRRDCVALGLSLYKSLTQAQDKYRSLAAANDDGGETARERYGDHIAEVILAPDDGVAGPPKNDGHFTFHQAENARFAPRASNVVRCEYFDELERNAS